MADSPGSPSNPLQGGVATTDSGAAALAGDVDSFPDTPPDSVVIPCDSQTSTGGRGGKKKTGGAAPGTAGTGNSPKVGVVTQTAAPTTNNGSYNVKWRFTLNKPAPTDGYIVQQVTYDYSYTSSTGAVTKGKKVYYEAWLVKKGQTTETGDAGYGFTDNATEPPHPSTAGKISQSGVIKFFPKSVTGNLGDPGVTPVVGPAAGTGFGGASAEPMSGALPSSGTQPAWWNTPGTPTSTRSVTTQWGQPVPIGPQYQSIKTSP